MNLQEASSNGFLDELAEIIQDEPQAQIILESFGFPRRSRPPFPGDNGPLDYWMNIGRQIDAGCLASGTLLDPLLVAVHRRYPANPLFNRLLAPEPPDDQPEQQNEQQNEQLYEPPIEQPPENGYVTILVQGAENAETVIDTARTIARHRNIQSDNISLSMANNEGVFLDLSHLTMEQAAAIASFLEEDLLSRGGSVKASAMTTDIRDYLYSRLFVEGPDQARFEINNIRATTPLKDVAQGVIEEAYSETFGGKGKEQREVVIDHQKEDGSTNRLDPNKSLHENKIQDGDTVHVLPESTAGSINIVIREEALAKAKAQVIRFANTHKGFNVSANSREKPTEYTFKFKEKSFGIRPTPDSEPPIIDQHEVFLFLPPDFPMKAPEVYWQNEIFHPNIHPKNGKVCLGVLEDNYQPGLDFANLCQLIMDIAGYRNYVYHEGYNVEAAKWAVSAEGQLAIHKIGGICAIEKIMEQERTPRPIRIKRLTK
jgi:hypothetical protein